MGHYDNCREGYCTRCGAAPGNIKNGVCEFCSPRGWITIAPTAIPIPTRLEYEAALDVVAAYQNRK